MHTHYITWLCSQHKSYLLAEIICNLQNKIPGTITQTVYNLEDCDMISMQSSVWRSSICVILSWSIPWSKPLSHRSRFLLSFTISINSRVYILYLSDQLSISRGNFPVNFSQLHAFIVHTSDDFLEWFMSNLFYSFNFDGNISWWKFQSPLVSGATIRNVCSLPENLERFFLCCWWRQLARGMSVVVNN